MPYIQRGLREEFDKEIDDLANKINGSFADHRPGVLNYCITQLILKTMPQKRYWAIAMVTGILKNVSDEFYRRYAVPYEDQKIKENGDVY